MRRSSATMATRLAVATLIVFAIIPGVGAGVSPSRSSGDSSPVSTERIRKAVVTLWQDLDRGAPDSLPSRNARPRCSAFFYHDTHHVLTAQHCIVGRRDLFISTPEGLVLWVTGVVASGEKLDVVELALEPKYSLNRPALHLAPTPAVGSRVIAFGASQLFQPPSDMRAGRVTNLGSPWLAGPVFATAARSEQGFSGGPVVDMAGNVVGITTNVLSPTFDDVNTLPRTAVQAVSEPAMSALRHFSPAVDLDAWNARFARTPWGKFNIAGKCVPDSNSNRDRIRAFRSILQTAPHYAEVEMQLGMCQMVARDTKAGLAAYERAVRIKPNAEAYYWIAKAYLDLGNTAAANRAFAKLRSRPASAIDPAILEALKRQANGR